MPDVALKAGIAWKKALVQAQLTYAKKTVPNDKELIQRYSGVGGKQPFCILPQYHPDQRTMTTGCYGKSQCDELLPYLMIARKSGEGPRPTSPRI